MTISRMLQPRQQYGLGSLVKKAVRGVKKIVKSPLGKAAILGGLGMYGMGAGPFSGMKGAGFLKGLISKGGIGKFFNEGLGKWINPMSGAFGADNKWKHAFGLGATALTALPFFMGKEKPEEEDDEPWTQIPSSIADIRAQAREHYRNPGASTLSFMSDIDYVDPTFYSANGGRAGLLNGGGAGEEQLQQMLMAEFIKYKNQGGQLTFKQFVQAVMQQQQEQQQGGGMEQPGEVRYAAQGGRIGKLRGGPLDEDEDEYNYSPNKVVSLLYDRSRRQEGGLMNLGDQEKDYRETGGFVDLGGKERADDVPARLSKNEFVFTADAVRAAGGGDIDAGSEVMQNMMDNLEQGGEISEESQGLEGAQAMYDQQQMLQSRIA